MQDVFLGHGLGIKPKGRWREEKDAGLGMGRIWAVMLVSQELSSEVGTAPSE